MADEEFTTPKDLSERTRRRLRWLLEEHVIAASPKRSRGWHEGQATDYPVTMIRRIEEFAARGRHSPDEWAFHLWIGGVPVIGIGERLVKHYDRLEIADIEKVIKTRAVLEENLTKAAARGKKRRLEAPRGSIAGPIFSKTRRGDVRHRLMMAMGGIAFSLAPLPGERGETDWEIISRAIDLPAPLQAIAARIAILIRPLSSLRETLLDLSAADAEQARLVSDVMDGVAGWDTQRSAEWIKFAASFAQWFQRDLAIRAFVVGVVVRLGASLKDLARLLDRPVNPDSHGGSP
jgi:hypothetical protein